MLGDKYVDIVDVLYAFYERIKMLKIHRKKNTAKNVYIFHWTLLIENFRLTIAD